MEVNNDLFSGKMKCKRCRAYVSDDSNVCPMCGEDLTFLRELLKSVYEEDSKPGEPQPAPASSAEPIQEKRPEPSVGAGEPRVILNSEPIDLGADYRVSFSMTDGLGGEETRVPGYPPACRVAAKEETMPKSKYPGVSKPNQGDKDDVPSGLGYATMGPDSVAAGEMAPLDRKAGLPGVGYKGTFSMLNANDDESDPY